MTLNTFELNENHCLVFFRLNFIASHMSWVGLPNRASTSSYQFLKHTRKQIHPITIERLHKTLILILKQHTHHHNMNQQNRKETCNANTPIKTNIPKKKRNLLIVLCVRLTKNDTRKGMKMTISVSVSVHIDA